MEKKAIQRIQSISEFHQIRGLQKPEHPLISVIDFSTMTRPANIAEFNWMLDFYQISIKRGMAFKMKYGQQQYDFDEGVMFFLAPQQIFSVEHDPNSVTSQSGFMLLIHPDFFWRTALAKTIRQYEFFDYAVHEALFLSAREEETLNTIMTNIQQELLGNMDKFSQTIIVSHIETLLNYSERFYERQFIVRKITNHQILDRMESLLNNYFNSDELLSKGLPTVQLVADELHISPNYLSRLLKTLTGQSTQQFIHDKLIERAKEKLSTTDLSVSEIAYQLGFEHPQSFTKLFKAKTSQSPLLFRQAFN